MRSFFAIFIAILATTSTAAFAADKKETPAPACGPDVAERILDAKKLLSGESIGTNRLGGQNALLAVWSASENKMQVVRVLGGISRTKGFVTKLVRQNGVNTLYEVTRPEGWVVLAIKTNVMKTAGKRRDRRTEPAIYVPYSKAISEPDMVAAGRDYLLCQADNAGSRLDDLDVRSMVNPDLLVTETVPERVLITLMIIEHIDPSDFKTFGAAEMTDMVFAMVGANRESSFAYSFSFAGAGGLAQFIRPTYRLTRTRYSSAKLMPDFIEGMRDHRNAIMAQYCLADWSLARLPTGVVTKLSVPEREEDLGAYLAAAYNGGEERASSVYLRDPAHWEEPGHGLKKETITYVREFRAVYRYLFTTPPPPSSGQMPPQTETPDP